LPSLHPAEVVRVTAIFMDPFTRGETIEPLYYIPPTPKGGVDEGIAGGRPVKIKISIVSPPTEGLLETAMREVPS
jgi:hypothetical protein